MDTGARQPEARGFFFLALVVLAACGEPRERLSHAISRAKLAEPPQELRSALERFTAGTRYEQAWAINPRRNDLPKLAVFLLDPESDWNTIGSDDRRLREARDNCRAFVDEEFIVCDAGFPEAFLSRYSVGTEDAPVFLSWLIGHEIGHLVEGTQGTHSLVADKSRPSIQSVESQRLEYGADCWMVHQFIEQSEPEDRLELQVLAMDLINSRFRDVTLSPPAGVGIIFDYTQVEPYDFVDNESHPDLILRSIRLLHVFAMETDPGLQPMLDPVIRKMVPDPLWDDEGPCSGIGGPNSSDS